MRAHNLCMTLALSGLLAGSFLPGCGDAGGADEEGRWLPYARSSVAAEFGEGAGFGQDHLPEAVLGPPGGARYDAAETSPEELVSLGDGGEIVLEFDRPAIVDGPGADFVVFENPFWVQGDPTDVWAELGEVSVSADGETWHTFECDTETDEPGQWPGCAGWTPTKQYDPEKVIPLDPEQTGGDAFDLADLDVERARFVRIRDLEGQGNADFDNVGFDLDAIGVVHFE